MGVSAIANARVLGSAQQDALQNITGSFEGNSTGFALRSVVSPNGALYFRKNGDGINPPSGSTLGYYDIFFDASRVARTSSETRGPNTALAPRLICY